MIFDENSGIAYTKDKDEADKYRVEDTVPTHFIKDEAVKKWREINGGRVNIYTRIIPCPCGKRLENFRDKCPKCGNVPHNIKPYYVLPVCTHKTKQVEKEFSFLTQDINLFGHQKDIVDFIDRVYNLGQKSAMVISGVGTGKTIAMLSIVKLLGISTCLVVPNSTIAQLNYDQFSKYIETKIIKGAKDIQLTRVNIMTHQTFNLIYNEINGKCKLLMLDEIHHCPEMRRLQINMRKGRFVCGVTATAIRKEFGPEGFRMLFGNVFDTNTEALPIKLYAHEFRYDYSTPEFMEAIKGLAPDSPEMYRRLVIENDIRNEELAKIIKRIMVTGKKWFIVFSDRIDHIKNVASHLRKEFANVWEYRGDTDKASVMQEVKNCSSGGVIVGNLQSCGEGFDVPKLEVGILFVSTQWTVTCEQAAGRIRRRYGDKTEGIFVDFIDAISFKGSQVKKLGRYERKKIYGKKGWKIHLI